MYPNIQLKAKTGEELLEKNKKTMISEITRYIVPFLMGILDRA